MNIPIYKQKVCILVASCIIIAVSFAIIFNRHPQLHIRSDFFVRWYAVTKLLEDGRDLYDPLNGSEVDQIIYGRDNDEIRMDFYYPAHLLIFISPLALLDYQSAHLVWTILGQLFFLLGIAIMIWVVKWPVTIERTAIYVFLIFLSYPMLLHCFYGQFNSIGVLALALTYFYLSRQRYALAGLTTVGLTFKPHPHILLLIFLFLWVLFKPERTRFYLSFGSSLLICWLCAELFQPGWIFSFINSLGRYPPLPSVIDVLGNPYQIVSLSFLFIALIIFWKNRHSLLNSPQCTGCFMLSLTVWALIFPCIFVFNILPMIIIQTALISSYKNNYPRYYKFVVTILLMVYLVGWGKCSLELLDEGWFIWTQLVYKLMYPVILSLLAWPLLFHGNNPINIIREENNITT